MLSNGFLILLQAITAFLIGTLLFDIVHFYLHRLMRSDHKIWQKLGRLHAVHHCFYPADLQIRTRWATKNIIQHVWLEHSIQFLGTAMCWFFLNHVSIIIALFAQMLLLMHVCYVKGEDAHHQSTRQLLASSSGLFVKASYHALHHIYPNQYFSGYIKIFDYLFGTGLQLNGKKIVMTGASGALGRHMKRLLEKEGATVTPCKYGIDYQYNHYQALFPIFKEADILFLCHGSKLIDAEDANCNSFVALIELFKTAKLPSSVPLEIWGVGSEIECHPCFGIDSIKVYARSKRNFAMYARGYFRDKKIEYRHFVHSAFISPMGPGLMTASFAARMTMFWLKRGFKYIPVTYTGFAYLNFFRFKFSKYKQASSI